MSLVSFLVPYRPDGGRRDENWSWVRARLAAVPGCEIVVGTSPRGPFNRAAAVNDAATRAVGEVLCVHDADCALPLDWYQAVRGLDGWVLPEGSRYLTAAATAGLISRSPAATIAEGLDAEEEVEHSVGGIMALSRSAFDTARGMDARFVGWGPEDAAFALCLETLVGPSDRFGGPLVHLWHPREPHARPWQPGVGDLMGKYWAAHGDPARMRALRPYEPKEQTDA